MIQRYLRCMDDDSVDLLRPEWPLLPKLAYRVQRRMIAANARVELERYLQRLPRLAQLRCELGQVEAIVGARKRRAEAAIGTLQNVANAGEPALSEENQLLAQRPNDPDVLNNLAWLYQQIGNLPKASELAERALGLAPANGQIADTLGWILLAQGDTKRALIHLEAASTAIPGNAEINYHFAVALGRAGRTADARAILERVLGSGAAFTGKAEAEKLLEDLKRG